MHNQVVCVLVSAYILFQFSVPTSSLPASFLVATNNTLTIENEELKCTNAELQNEKQGLIDRVQDLEVSLAQVEAVFHQDIVYKAEIDILNNKMYVSM